MQLHRTGGSMNLSYTDDPNINAYLKVYYDKCGTEPLKAVEAASTALEMINEKMKTEPIKPHPFVDLLPNFAVHPYLTHARDRLIWHVEHVTLPELTHT
jgi:hypothetical protein